MNAALREHLLAGQVIPALPLALDTDRKFDKQSQRALSRYYLDAGSGGLAVGVHSTQFAIREVGLYRPVLELAIDTARDWTDRPLVMIAGAVGRTAQAVEEARTARSLGYHAVLSREFWTRFAAIDNVVAIKVAPFNRYRTLDVCFGIAAAHAEDRITLYTGNDDHIVADLVTPMVVRTGNREVTLRFQGGLLGHWSVWTRGAVTMLERLKLSVSSGAIAPEILALDSFVTDCNSVVFDVDHDFAGCIPGCHEILRRQGLLRSIECLDPHEKLSPGQSEGIDRLYATYPELHDDAFVAANLERWRN